MKRCILMLIIFSLLMPALDAKAEDYQIPEAASYVLMDAKTGQILLEKNGQKQLHPASTTKVLTAILALESGNLDKICIAGIEAVKDIGKDGMNIAIVPGEELTLETLLNALLVRSANETANIIAENLAPTREAFIQSMNIRAKELGATQTNFVNVNGKDSDPEDIAHLTTAADLAFIARHAMTFPKFREIVAKRLATIPPSNKREKELFLGNTNKLLGNGYKSLVYSEVTGIKTGYTDKAGNNLIASAVDQQGRELISVVLGFRKGNIFQASRGLLEHGFLNFEGTRLVEKGSFLKSIPATHDAKQSLDLVAGEDLVVYFPKNSSGQAEIIKKERLRPTIPEVVHVGDPVGTLEYYVMDRLVGQVPILSNTQMVPDQVIASDAKSSSSASILWNIILFLLALGTLFLFLRYRFGVMQTPIFSKFSISHLKEITHHLPRFSPPETWKIKIPKIRRKRKEKSQQIRWRGFKNRKNLKHTQHFPSKWGS